VSQPPEVFAAIIVSGSPASFAEQRFSRESDTRSDSRPLRIGAHSARCTVGSPTLSGEPTAAHARSVARFGDDVGLSGDLRRVPREAVLASVAGAAMMSALQTFTASATVTKAH
jgi:hypothetical protein